MNQADIIAAVRAGHAVHQWVPLDVGRIRVWVMPDALKVDGVRVPVTAATEQEIADLLGAMLLTPRLVDVVFQLAKFHAEPHLLQPTAGWGQIAERSAAIDAELIRLNAQSTDIVAPVGKDWVLSSKLTPRKACNYGLHAARAPYAAATLPGVHVWQPIGHAHNAQHQDWSQLCRLVRRRCLVDGREADLREVLSDPVLAPLVSHEGVLHVVRQPGVDEHGEPETLPAPAQVITLPEITIYATPPPTTPPAPTTPPPASLAGDEPGIPYVPARHYRAGRRGPPIWIVVHTAEVGETPNAAEALQRYAATMADGRVASWHFAIDSDSITQSVRERDTAFHAKQANARGIGLELCQRAAQNVAQWDDAYSRAVLARAAPLCRRAAQRWSIPVRRLTPEQILAGEPGFAGHVDFTSAFKVSGGHVDPGPHFPWARFLALVTLQGD